MKKKQFTKEEMEEIVKSSFTVKECLEKMKRSTIGGNYRTFYRYKDLYGLDTSHFNPEIRKIKSAKEYFNKKGTYIKSSLLLEKLIKEGLKERKCEECGLSEWRGKEIKLQLHHVDGNHFNNDITNLKILCPNCHSQTENYCGRNRIVKKDNTEFYCSNCGKKLYRKAKSGLCADCIKVAERKVARPSKEDLYHLLCENSFTAVGKIFNVSDNAVKKWCKHYGIPSLASYYKNSRN